MTTIRSTTSTAGGTAWSFSDITLDNVERIELIRGPGSALYGANAFSGVINIITRRHHPNNTATADNDRQNHINFVSLAGGTRNTAKISTLLGASGEQWSISGFARSFDTNGFALDIEQDILGASGKTDDWQKQQDFDLWLTWRDFTVHSRYLNKRRGPFINITDALAPGSHRELEHFFTELLWRADITETANLQTKLFLEHHEFDNHWVGYPPGFFMTTTTNLTGYSTPGSDSSGRRATRRFSKTCLLRRICG